MADNNDTLKIRVELDTSSLQSSVKAAEGQVKSLTNETRSFFELEARERQKVKQAFDERIKLMHQYGKELGVSQTALQKMMVLHDRAERQRQRDANKALQDSEKQRREDERRARQLAQQQRARAQAATNPRAAISGSPTGAAFGAVLAAGGFGGGLLPTVGGSVAGALGASVPMIAGITAGLAAINQLINLGVGLVKTWVGVWYEYRQTIDRAKLGIGAFLGSTQKASEFTQDLIKDLRGLGDLDSSLVLARRLLSVGVAADQARKQVKELNTVAIGLGLNTQEQKGLAKALSDVVTAGRLRGQEVLQFNNAGVNIRALLADKLSVNQAQVADLIKKGKISAEQVITAISDYAKKFDPVLEQAMLLPEVSQKRIEQSFGRLGDQAFGSFYESARARLKQLADELENEQSLSVALAKSTEALAEIGFDAGGRFARAFFDGLTKEGFFGFLRTAGDATSGQNTSFAMLNLLKNPTLAFARGFVKDSLVQKEQYGDQGGALTAKEKERMAQIVQAEEERRKLEAEKNKDKQGSFGGGGDKPRNRRRSFSEQLDDRLKTAKANVEALTNLNSANFADKFKLEGYERFQKDLESILNLRYEMNLEFAKPLPKTPEAAKQLREELESAKRVFEAVKEAREEQRKASEEYASALLTAVLPVVGDEIRYQTQYLRLLRERKNEEAQLTAELKLEVRKRIDAYESEEEKLREQRMARNEVFTGALREGEEARRDRLRAEAELSLFNGNTNVFDIIGENIFEPVLSPMESLDKTAANILELLQQAFAGKAPAVTTATGGGAPAGAPGLGGGDNGGGGSDAFRFSTRDLSFADLTKTTLRDRVDAQLAKDVVALNKEIFSLEYTERRYQETAISGTLRQLREKKRLLEQQAALREETERSYTLEQELVELGNAASTRTALARQQADNRILESQIATKERIIGLQEEIANASVGASDRYQEAWLEATLDIATRQEEAVKRQIKAQAELSQKTVFSADEVRAQILEQLAATKSVNDILAESYLSVMNGIGDSLETVLTRATDKLGAFGRTIGSISAQLLRMVTNRVLMQLLNGFLPGGGGFAGVTGTAAAAGGGGGGGGGSLLRTPGFNPLGFVSNLFSGGGSAAGTGASGAVALNSTLTSAFGGLSYNTAAARSAGAAGVNLPIFNSVQIPGITTPGINGAGTVGIGSAAAAGKFSLGSVGKQLAAAAPFLGFSLGAAAGGQSTAGSLLGGIGGSLGGLVLAASTGALGGSLGSAFALSGALGPAALIAAPLLIGASILLGRAKQRKQDEPLADSYWVAYKDRLIELTSAVKRGSIDGDDALAEAAKARAEAVAAISSIKTKSVRESRLRNQIPDVDRLFLEPLKQAAADQKNRVSLASKLIPEFAVGGVVPGAPGEPRLILAHGGEIIANPRQQTPELVDAAARAGVPGLRDMQGAGTGTKEMQVTLVIGTDAQNQMFVNGANSSEGFRVLLGKQHTAKRFNDLRL